MIEWLISKKISLYGCRNYPASEGVGNEYLSLQSSAGLACATRGMDAAA